MEEEPKTVDAFLKSIAKTLKENGRDQKLSEILATHILNATPAQDAIALAKAAIVKLAVDRAVQGNFDGADV